MCGKVCILVDEGSHGVQKSIGSPGADVTGGSEIPYVGARNRLRSFVRAVHAVKP